MIRSRSHELQVPGEAARRTSSSCAVTERTRHKRYLFHRTVMIFRPAGVIQNQADRKAGRIIAVANQKGEA